MNGKNGLKKGSENVFIQSQFVVMKTKSKTIIWYDVMYNSRKRKIVTRPTDLITKKYMISCKYASS